MTLWGLTVSQRNTPTAHTLASVPGDQCPEPCLVKLGTQHQVQLYPHGSFIRKLRHTLRHRACFLEPFLTDLTQVLWKCLPGLLGRGCSVEPLSPHTSQPTTGLWLSGTRYFQTGRVCLSLVPPTQEKLHSDYSSSSTSQASKDPLTRQPRHSEGTLTKDKGWAEGRGTRPHPRQVPQLLPPPWLGGQGFRVHPAELPFLPSD